MLIDKNSLFTLPEGMETRWASPENPRGEKGKAAQSGGGRKGLSNFPLKAGEQRILAEETGKVGTIRRIWVTIDDRSLMMLRGLRLDFFWDGVEKPAVSVPLGDFFGIGLGRTTAFQSALFTSPEGRSFNCYMPMPFKNGMKLVVTNDSDKNLGAFFYDINYTVGDNHSDDMLYFHAHYHRENPTIIQKDYEILPTVSGKGRFVGSNIGVAVNRKNYFNTWWGEGEVKIYLDGDEKYPTLCGTGTEDYIGTGWGQGKYDNLYQGCPIADRDIMQYCFYRYHIPDPVYFRKDVRVTIQQLGVWGRDSRPLFHYNDSKIYSTSMEPLDFSKTGIQADRGLMERSDDWSSCAYFYLDSPENKLLEIDPFEKRVE